MSDTTDTVEVVEPGTTEEQVEVVEAMEATEPKVEKNVSKPCFCSYFEVGNFDPDVKDEDAEIFTTGCAQSTKRTFAQGHDARLVSFLVDGFFDGYDLRLVEGGVSISFADPAGAAARASDALAVKAEKATAVRRAKMDAAAERKNEREAKKAATAEAKATVKAEREAAAAKAKAEKEAAKASKPQAEVVAGSQEGDVPELPEGEVRIKVGRWEYNAVLDADTGAATFTDGKGDEQTVERDGYRLLQNA
jgi:hypothetical protein